MSWVQRPFYCFKILIIIEHSCVVSVACFVSHWQLKSSPPPTAPRQLAPENIRRGSAYQTLPHQGGWLASDGATKGMDGRSGRYHTNEYYASHNDMGLLNFNRTDIPDTETLVKKVHISQFGEIEWKIVISMPSVLSTGGEGIIPARCVCN
ncbi:Protein EMSY-LIKE 4 [Zea mays]|uniref:Protein EMSY-LIKE 4 n=1 Tax=Zea mays TaxID=4577 RepID=A0A1D6QKS0_MAIZE|nr:Protein EMSY-LIKE 4 [Zea mays]